MRIAVRPIVVSSIVLSALTTAAAADLVSIRTRDGRTIVARIDGVDDAGNYVGQTEEGAPLSIPERDVLSVDPKVFPGAARGQIPVPPGDEEALRRVVRKILAEELSGMKAPPAGEDAAGTSSPPPSPASKAHSPPPSRWCPGSVGSWWVYRREGGPNRGRERWQVLSASPWEDGLTRIEILVQSLDDDAPDGARRWYYLGSEALSAGAPPGRGGDLLLRSPLREGESWTWSTAARIFRRTCRSLSDTVQTPAGTFSGCLSIRAETAIRGLEGVSSAETIAFAPDVGIVRIEGGSRLILLEYGIAR